MTTNFHRVISASFSPDSRLLAIRGDHPIAQVWDLGSHQLAANLLHDERVKSVVFFSEGQEFDVVVTSLSFSPDGQTLATGSQDGLLRVWTQAGKQSRMLQAHEGSVNAIGFAGPTRIVTGGTGWSDQGLGPADGNRGTDLQATAALCFAPGRFA